MNAEPKWAELIRQTESWTFRDGVLFHCDAPDEVGAPTAGALKRLVVNQLYAAQKNSRTVKRAMQELLAEFQDDHWGLNFGAGETKIHDRILNLDLGRGELTDIVNAGMELPFRDGTLDLVISQEVLEHVDNPQHWISEIHRVLKPGGRFYCQLPFIIGYHPGPTDFWRFSKEAYPQLFPEPTWEIEKLELALGHGSGLYRILVEFFAVTASVIHSKLYMPTKGLFAILCWPLQWFDGLTRFSKQKDRIPGGYYCVVRKS
jgi:SAM-dependent methyltransferase